MPSEGSYEITESFMLKEQGLFVVIEKEDNRRGSLGNFQKPDPIRILIYVPRSSITKAKDTKSIIMTPKGLLVQQNPGIQPLDITFLVLIDTTFYFVQAKELTASSSADL